MSDTHSVSTFARQIVSAFSEGDEHIAFIQDDCAYTYAEAHDLLWRLVRAFRERDLSGCGFAGLSPNCAEVYLAELAAMLVGGRFSGLHPLGSAQDHSHVCDDAEVAGIIAHPSHARHAHKVSEMCQSASQLLTLGPSPHGIDLLALARAAGPASPEPGPAMQMDSARVMYTSGTTGGPKGCVLTHAGIAQMVFGAHHCWEAPHRPVYLATSPITHAAFLLIMPTLLSGGTVVMHTSFEPLRWLNAVQEHRVNCAFMVPTMIYSLLDHPDLSSFDLSSLETVMYGGSPMSPHRLREALQKFGSVFTQIYGQTESLALGTVLRKSEHDPEHFPERMASCGRPCPGVEIELLDPADHPVAVGETGEVCIRAATNMREYWRAPELSAEATRGGRLHTGDVAVRDEAGFLYIVDRLKDMIVSGGFNISPREIEDVLSSHPDVSSAAVVGAPDDRWGETVRAFVVPKSDVEVNTDELVSLVKTRKGSYYAPKRVDVVEALPLTGVGKVDKKELRREFWLGRDRRVH